MRKGSGLGRGVGLLPKCGIPLRTRSLCNRSKTMIAGKFSTSSDIHSYDFGVSYRDGIHFFKLYGKGQFLFAAWFENECDCDENFVRWTQGLLELG